VARAPNKKVLSNTDATCFAVIKSIEEIYTVVLVVPVSTQSLFYPSNGGGFY
jgi:hypothetical protein